MNKPPDSPFSLPIHLTGIGGTVVQKAAFRIALSAWVVVGALVAVAWALGLARPGTTELLGDAAFFLVRRPAALERSLASLYGAPWGPATLLLAFALVAWMTAPPVIQITSAMAHTLSIGDQFPRATRQTRWSGAWVAAGF